MGFALILITLGGCLLIGQTQAPGLKERPAAAAPAIQVDAGTHVLLQMKNSVSTRTAMVGQRLYLATAFPVLVNGRIVIPQGSYVMGTVTDVKRPGRVKGRGELQVRFDSLTFENGVTRDFRADLGAIDALNTATLERENSKIKSPGDKKSDTETVVRSTAAGAAIGTGVGAATGHLGGGSIVGLAAGGAYGLIGVLTSRGPDAILASGSTVEMVLDRPLVFMPEELPTGGASNAPRRAN